MKNISISYRRKEYRIIHQLPHQNSIRNNCKDVILTE